MKKRKLLISLAAVAFVVAVVGGFGLWANAQDNIPTVTYNDGTDGSKAAFTVTNAGSGSATDLFPEFKNCMPGDTLTQEIKIQAASTNKSHGAKIAMYVEIDDDAVAKTGSNANVTNKDVLSRIIMTVKNADGVVIARNHLTALDEATTPQSQVSLGEVKPGEAGQVLTVTIEIDSTMGNAFQEAVSHLNLNFTAEDNDDPAPPPVNTKDHFAYIVGYPDGGVHPEGNITRAEVATIFFRMLTDDARSYYWSQANGYTDVNAGMWFNNAVSTLSNSGVLSGYPDGSFGPNKPITRAEFATIATRFFKATDAGSTDAFTDISGHWARDFINRAAKLDLVGGYPDGTFHPEKYITRAEAITIVNRILKRAPSSDYFLPGMAVWTDNADPSAWYYEAVQEATNSHDYTRETASDGTEYEVWKTLLPVRNWAELEKEWSDAASGSGSGEVIIMNQNALQID